MKSLEENGETNLQLIKRLKKIILKVIENDLTVKQKEVVKLYFFDNKKIPQIAALKSLNKSTVSRHIKSAKVKIKQLLKYVLELGI
jgi:RNA polymerase sigma factor (sigma-70 family)